MKNLILTVILTVNFVTFANAQYCGTSGPSVCTPGNLTQAGFNPVYDSLRPIISCADNAVMLGFKNFDSVSLNGRRIAIRSLKIDSINNLPLGYCWATSDTDNTFTPGQNACILLQGTPGIWQSRGQYKLVIFVDIDTGTIVASIPTEQLGFDYYIRVNCNDSSTINPVFQYNGYDTLFFAYSDQVECFCTNDIVERQMAVQSLNIFPNPFGSQTEVSFTCIKDGTMTEEITNVLGTSVYKKQIGVKAGQNAFSIERNDLAAGVYFYTIRDGLSVSTVRLVIMD